MEIVISYCQRCLQDLAALLECVSLMVLSSHTEPQLDLDVATKRSEVLQCISVVRDEYSLC